MLEFAIGVGAGVAASVFYLMHVKSKVTALEADLAAVKAKIAKVV